jgi:hypothetical protein
MPEIELVTELLGRLCAIPVEIGGSITTAAMSFWRSDEATAARKSIVVKLDDVVTERYAAIAIVET